MVDEDAAFAAGGGSEVITFVASAAVTFDIRSADASRTISDLTPRSTPPRRRTLRGAARRARRGASGLGRSRAARRSPPRNSPFAMSGGNYMFVMVAHGDTPIYEAEFLNTQRREDTSHLNQFIIHAALDMVDETVWGTSNMYLKCVDKFNDYFISAFVTAGHIKLMLLHDVRNEDGIKNFFQEVHELYVKVLMNPFYDPKDPISSSLFDARVKVLGRKYF